MPAIYSTVVLGVLARLVLQVDGPLNQMLSGVDLGGLARDWLGDSSTALPAVPVVIVWANFGYDVVLYPRRHERHRPRLPEAAGLDGANQLQISATSSCPGWAGHGEWCW